MIQSIEQAQAGILVAYIADGLLEDHPNADLFDVIQITASIVSQQFMKYPEFMYKVASASALSAGIEDKEVKSIHDAMSIEVYKIV